jgi:hypothetical protein
MNVDGHIVRDSDVWTATDFPVQTDYKNNDPVGATEDLVAVFKNGGTSGVFTYYNNTDKTEISYTAPSSTSLLWTNPKFPGIELYENIPMTPEAASFTSDKHQAYHIIGSDKKRIMNWISPVAVIDSRTGNPVAGYSGIVKYKGTALQAAGTQWALATGNWEFVYMAGLLTFSPDAAPAKNCKDLTLTAFRYNGEKLSTKLTNLSTAISNSREMFQATAYINGEAIYADDALSSTISAAILQKADFANDPVLSGLPAGSVIISGFPAEVLSVKEIRGTKSEEIYPDIDYTAKANGVKESTTLSAEYATSDEVVNGGIQWQLTFRM